jgi:hypothetical protein
MALFQRENPKGIDQGIDILQRDLFIELVKQGWTSYDSYDRAYRNTRGSDKIPEIYIGNNEYLEVLMNDKRTATSFFLSDDKRTYDYEKLLWTQNISMIFQCNISKLYPDVLHQPDEEMINTIRLAIKSKYWDNRLSEIITGFENVYDSLKLSYNKKDFTDMADFSIARFNFQMVYSNTEKIIFIK